MIIATLQKIGDLARFGNCLIYNSLRTVIYL